MYEGIVKVYGAFAEEWPRRHLSPDHLFPLVMESLDESGF